MIMTNFKFVVNNNNVKMSSLLKKHSAFLVTVTLSTLLFGASVSLVAVSGWSNGGFSVILLIPIMGHMIGLHSTL